MEVAEILHKGFTHFNSYSYMFDPSDNSPRNLLFKNGSSANTGNARFELLETKFKQRVDEMSLVFTLNAYSCATAEIDVTFTLTENVLNHLTYLWSDAH